MSDNVKSPRSADQPELPEEPEADTEGHNMWIGPATGRELARDRNAEIERQTRERQRAKEAQKRR